MVNTILRGPELERAGSAEWTLPLLCRWAVRGLDLSRQKTRLQHQQANKKAR